MYVLHQSVALKSRWDAGWLRFRHPLQGSGEMGSCTRARSRTMCGRSPFALFHSPVQGYEMGARGLHRIVALKQIALSSTRVDSAQ